MNASPPAPRPRRTRLALVALVSSLAGGLAAAVHFGLVAVPGATSPPAAGDRAAPAPRIEAPEPIAVTAVAAAARVVEERVRTVGTLHGFEEITVAPLVDGRVARVVHDVGDLVVPGDELLRIDDTDYRLALEEAERGLELELAALGLSTPPDPSFDITRLPAVERADLVERDAAATLERYRGLEERNAVTEDDMQRAVLALDTAVLDRRQKILDAERALASVRHREATLEVARKRLADTRILAPQVEVRTFDGSSSNVAAATPARRYAVAARLVAEGEVVRGAPPTALYRLVVEDVLELRASIPERHAARVAAGQETTLDVESLPGVPVTGRVVRVGPTIDTTSRTFDIEVQVPNDERRLKPGAFAKASILVGQRDDAVTVPEEALVRFAGVTRLFAVEGDVVRAVVVNPGDRVDVPTARGARRWVEIPAGLSAGTTVVTSGHGQLTDGARVRVRPAAEDAP